MVLDRLRLSSHLSSSLGKPEDMMARDGPMSASAGLPHALGAAGAHTQAHSPQMHLKRSKRALRACFPHQKRSTFD